MENLFWGWCSGTQWALAYPGLILDWACLQLLGRYIRKIANLENLRGILIGQTQVVKLVNKFWYFFVWEFMENAIVALVIVLYPQMKSFLSWQGFFFGLEALLGNSLKKSFILRLNCLMFAKIWKPVNDLCCLNSAKYTKGYSEKNMCIQKNVFTFFLQNSPGRKNQVKASIIASLLWWTNSKHFQVQEILGTFLKEAIAPANVSLHPDWCGVNLEQIPNFELSLANFEIIPKFFRCFV